MAKGGKRGSKKHGAKASDKFVALILGLVLVLCGASAAVGVMNWISHAYGEDIAGNVRVEVLNGTGQDGLGRVVARALMRKKVDVLIVGNADSFDYHQTVLIARKEKPEVRSLGELIGCERFVEQLRDDTMVDATLIIGSDYRRLKLGLEGESSLSE